MDSDSDVGQDATHYTVIYACGGASKVDHDKREESNKKRCSVGRASASLGRVKRVVSCKRKTHHLVVARKKQVGPGKALDTANKENERSSVQDVQGQTFELDPWEFQPNVSNTYKTGRTGSDPTDCLTLTELKREHGTMTEVLFGRNLRLKVALTLWRRNTAEVLMYFVRIQDTGVFVDLLPLISTSIAEDRGGVTIGFCVDLFPLVREVLSSPYEEYLLVGLRWIHAVLAKWSQQLRANVCGRPADPLLDKNFQMFNKQMLDLWHQEPSFRSLPGPAGVLSKVIDSFLSQLSC